MKLLLQKLSMGLSASMKNEIKCFLDLALY
jgi:hypothetical protein